MSGKILRLHTLCLLVALVSWLSDKVLCKHLNDTMNPQLHSWWHVLMSLSAHYALLFEILLRYKLSNDQIKLKGGLVIYPDTRGHTN